VARCSPEGSRRFRPPDFHDIRHMKVLRLSASRTGRLYRMKCSWYSFSLGAESTPGPWYGRKEYVTEKSSDTTGNRSRNRPNSTPGPTRNNVSQSKKITCMTELVIYTTFRIGIRVIHFSQKQTK